MAKKCKDGGSYKLKKQYAEKYNLSFMHIISSEMIVLYKYYQGNDCYTYTLEIMVDKDNKLFLVLYKYLNKNQIIEHCNINSNIDEYLNFTPDHLVEHIKKETLCRKLKKEQIRKSAVLLINEFFMGIECEKVLDFNDRIEYKTPMGDSECSTHFAFYITDKVDLEFFHEGEEENVSMRFKNINSEKFNDIKKKINSYVEIF